MRGDWNWRIPLVGACGATLGAVYAKSGLLDNLDPSSAVAFVAVWVPCAILLGWGVAFAVRRWRN
jgi:hypothetical protein